MVVQTDANQTGVGAVLYQEVPEGYELGGKSYEAGVRYVAFTSKGLNSGQRGYSATKRELYAIVHAVEEFREWIYGCEFTLRTDSKALTYMYTQTEVNPMIQNWFRILLDYNIGEVDHIPGIMNVLPDVLSRQYEEAENAYCRV